MALISRDWAATQVSGSCVWAVANAHARPLYRIAQRVCACRAGAALRGARAQPLGCRLRQGPSPRRLGGNIWQSLATHSFSRRFATIGRPYGPKHLLTCSSSITATAAGAGMAYPPRISSVLWCSPCCVACPHSDHCQSWPALPGSAGPCPPHLSVGARRRCQGGGSSTGFGRTGAGSRAGDWRIAPTPECG